MENCRSSVCELSNFCIRISILDLSRSRSNCPATLISLRRERFQRQQILKMCGFNSATNVERRVDSCVRGSGATNSVKSFSCSHSTTSRCSLKRYDYASVPHSQWSSVVYSWIGCSKRRLPLSSHIIVATFCDEQQDSTISSFSSAFSPFGHLSKKSRRL